MSLFPSNINFNYEKFSGTLPSKQIDLALIGESPIAGVTWQKPSWLNIIFDGISPGQGSDVYNYTVTVNANESNNLPIGTTNATAVATYYDSTQSGLVEINLDLNVSILVSEYIALSISPTEILYNEVVGSVNPPPSPLQISTSNNWSIISDQAWVSFDVSNGNGSQQIQVAVDISAFVQGTYTAQLLVDDGQSQKTATITINMMGSSTGNQYVIATPDLIEFSENQQEAPQSSAEILVESTIDVTISCNMPWLNLSVNSLTAGINTFTINVQNTETFNLGTYLAEILIESIIGVEKVNVLLLIINPETSGIESSGFYFSEDRNKLNLVNAQNNAEALLEHKVTTAEGLKIYKRKIPYFQNQIQAVIGLETRNLLKPIFFPDLLTSKFYTPFTPLVYNLNIFNKNIGQTALTANNNFENLNFVNGEHPKTALEHDFNLADIEKQTTFKTLRLSHLPKVVYTHKKAFIFFSFYSEQTPENCTLSGDATDTIALNVVGNKIYSVFINLSSYNLQTGDSITINCNVIKSTVFIKREEVEDVKVLWQNQWDLIECFNASGQVNIKNKSTSDEAEYEIEGKLKTETYNVKTYDEFEINTGLIHSFEELRFLSKIVESKKIWIIYKNQRIEVQKLFNDIDVYETRRFENSRRLKFKPVLI